jgi:hypothetical protein
MEDNVYNGNDSNILKRNLRKRNNEKGKDVNGVDDNNAVYSGSDSLSVTNSSSNNNKPCSVLFSAVLSSLLAECFTCLAYSSLSVGIYNRLDPVSLSTSSISIIAAQIYQCRKEKEQKNNTVNNNNGKSSSCENKEERMVNDNVNKENEKGSKNDGRNYVENWEEPTPEEAIRLQWACVDPLLLRKKEEKKLDSVSPLQETNIVIDENLSGQELSLAPLNISHSTSSTDKTKSLEQYTLDLFSLLPSTIELFHVKRAVINPCLVARVNDVESLSTIIMACLHTLNRMNLYWVYFIYLFYSWFIVNTTL